MQEKERADAPNPPRQDAPTNTDTPMMGVIEIIAPDSDGETDGEAARAISRALDRYRASGAIEIANASPLAVDDGRTLCSVTVHRATIHVLADRIHYIEAAPDEDALDLLGRQICIMARVSSTEPDDLGTYKLLPLGTKDGEGESKPLLILDIVADLMGQDGEERAEAMRAEAARIIEARTPRGRLERITASGPVDAAYPTDKFNARFWGLWRSIPKGQLPPGFKEDGSGSFKIDLANREDKKAGTHRAIVCQIDFKSLEDKGIIPQLSPYDKRVYVALSSLWCGITKEEGRSTFSIAEIYHEMGKVGNPSKSARQRINDSLTKMAGAHIRIDNMGEFKAYERYGHFRYDGQLLPMERLSGYIDGQLVEGLVHLFREPPAYTFGHNRKQFTSFGVELLQTQIQQTDDNLATEDYLIRQISWMKRGGGNRSRRITLADMFEDLGLDKGYRRTRCRDTAKKALDHYVKCKWIEGYKADSEAIVIELQGDTPEG